MLMTFLILNCKARAYDGDARKCFHAACFFEKFRPRSRHYIDGFGNLSNADQDRLEEFLGIVLFLY